MQAFCLICCNSQCEEWKEEVTIHFILFNVDSKNKAFMNPWLVVRRVMRICTFSHKVVRHHVKRKAPITVKI